MSEKLTHPPVFYTFAQVRFNPIERMEEYVPKLQDRLRMAGYPDFQREERTEFILQPNPGSPAVRPHARQISRWSFSNRERSAGFLLDKDSLGFQETVHETFPNLLAAIVEALEALHAEATLDYVEHVGLRYLDAIIPDGGRALHYYLSDSLLGLPKLPDSQLKHSLSNTVLNVKGGTLFARSLIIEEGSLQIPPDLFPITLQLSERIANIQGQHAILDINHFFQGREAFSTKSVHDKLNTCHDVVKAAFKKSVTREALQEWE